MIAAHLLRPLDRDVARRDASQDGRTLRRRFEKDRRVALVMGDGYGALNAWLPRRRAARRRAGRPPFRAAR